MCKRNGIGKDRNPLLFDEVQAFGSGLVLV